MAAAALMALAPAAAGLVGGIAGNITNKSIAGSNNAFNERMLMMQMDYNDKMYERQLGDQWKFYEDYKAYNSPVQQVQRLKEAGLNPALYMGAGNTGQVQSQTPPSAQGINPPSATPYSMSYDGMVQGIGSAINAYMALKKTSTDNALTAAQTRNTEIEGSYIASKYLAELALLKSQAKSLDTKREIDEIIKAYLPSMQSADLRLKGQQAEQNDMNLKLANVEYMMQSQRLQALPLQIKLGLAVDAANLAKLKAEKNLTDAQVKHEAEKMAETAAKKIAQQGQNKLFKKTFQEQVDLIRTELIRSTNNSGPASMLQYMDAAGKLPLFGKGKNGVYTPGVFW